MFKLKPLNLGALIAGLVFGIMFSAIIDLFLIFSCGIFYRRFFTLIFFVAAFVFMYFLYKRIPKVGIAVLLVIPLLVSALAFIYFDFRKNSAYESIPVPQKEFFSNKTVMLIVPHEDDDINLVSGMIDNYIQCNSTVYPVFVTNGDYLDLGQERINEAIKEWGLLGVPEENVYFLGYGDQWNENGPHIINAPDDMHLTSAVGKTETYGIPTHPAYHNGNTYTHDNYINDLKSLILEKKPDVIFASDADPHVDHIAVSIAFEQVMGEILKEKSDYRPIVYKGYAYATAWHAVDDFYALNMFSTKKPAEGECASEIYDWDKRVRLPVGTGSVARSVFDTDVYNSLSCHKTQNATGHVKNIVNSDKVFWQRRTDSLLMNADMRVSSGDPAYLNDFKIFDSNVVNSCSRMSSDGVWVPNKNDDKKTIHVELKNASDINRIVLYDNPSTDDNVMEAKIVFPDGSAKITGELDPKGCATYVDVNKNGVDSFDIILGECTGENAGIAEIEAFKDKYQKNDSFIKLVNKNSDFIYDYITEGNESEYTLYSNDPDIPGINDDDYEVSIRSENPKCTYEIVNDKLIVNCPLGSSMELTVKEKTKGLNDTVIINNAGLLERMVLTIGQYIEQKYVYPFSEGAYVNTAIYRFYERVKNGVTFITSAKK